MPPKRTDDDSWDLATSVGATATLVATARALASRQPDPLIDDPFAESLVRAVGVAAFSDALDSDDGLADGETARLLIDVVAVRTRFYDDFFVDSATAGIRQAVILASGLDARAYRLDWPPGMTVFEIDQPDVIAFKSRLLDGRGVSPSAERRAVGIDLRDDWAAALHSAGFDEQKPTAWIAEGLLVYLPPEAQDRLLDAISELSAPESRFATEYHPDGGAGIARRAAPMSAQLAASGLDLNLGDLFYASPRNSVVDHLQQLGWEVSARSRAEVFAAYGRHFPAGAADQALGNSLAVTAKRCGTTTTAAI